MEKSRIDLKTEVMMRISEVLPIREDFDASGEKNEKSNWKGC